MYWIGSFYFLFVRQRYTDESNMPLSWSVWDQNVKHAHNPINLRILNFKIHKIRIRILPYKHIKSGSEAICTCGRWAGSCPIKISTRIQSTGYLAVHVEPDPVYKDIKPGSGAIWRSVPVEGEPDHGVVSLLLIRMVLTHVAPEHPAYEITCETCRVFIGQHNIYSKHTRQ